jgi:phosphohistidine phosphatase SixA
LRVKGHCGADPPQGWESHDVRRILVLLFVVIAATAPVRTQHVDPSGIYRCEGKSAEGRPYQAVVEIKKNGDTYLLAVGHARSVAHVGIGVIEGKNLSVGFFGATVGVVVYAMEGSEKLNGQWTVLQAEGAVYRETLTRWHEGEPMFRPRPSGPEL